MPRLTAVLVLAVLSLAACAPAVGPDRYAYPGTMATADTGAAWKSGGWHGGWGGWHDNWKGSQGGWWGH